jgi:hypothetical protein
VFDQQINDDMIWSAGSVLFVFFYIWFHLGSGFLAVISMLMILLSFPLTQFIYTCIFQVKFNAEMN